MTTKEQHTKFWSGLIAVLVFLIAAVSIVGGVGIVVTRQKAETSAATIDEAERKIAELELVIAELDNRMARLHQPEVLLRRAQEMGLRLQPPTRSQIRRMGVPAPLVGSAGTPVTVVTADNRVEVYDLAMFPLGED